MKKILYFISFIIFFMFFCNPTIVVAEKTPNGIAIESSSDNTVSLYCEWYSPKSQDDFYSINIDRASTDDAGNVEGNAAIFNEASDKTLKANNFMHPNGAFDCPKFIVLDKNNYSVKGFTNEDSVSDNNSFVWGLKYANSLCTGKCGGSQQGSKTNWSCDYKGPSGALTIKYDGLFMAYYPDGKYSEIMQNDTDPSCPDLYYNKNTHEMRRVYYDFSKQDKNQQITEKDYNILCKNNGEYEYYCAGNCQFPNNATFDCSQVEVFYKPWNLCSGEFGKMLKELTLLVKFSVPILIIIFSIVDFSKAILSQNQDDLKKSSNKLIKRVIIGLIVILLPTLINVLLYLAGIDAEICL